VLHLSWRGVFQFLRRQAIQQLSDGEASHAARLAPKR